METNFKKIKQEASVEGGYPKPHMAKCHPGSGDLSGLFKREKGIRDGGSTAHRKKNSLASNVTVHNEMFQGSGVGGCMKPEPDHFTQISPAQGADSQAVCFTIQPTEEDIKKMQTGRDATGYIKRPLNAFMVWSNIHRKVVQKAYTRSSVKILNARLGLEWSKLSKEQKEPYFQVARKLQHIHSQQFPDYTYQPRKRGRQQESSVSFFSQEKTTLFSVQPMLLVPVVFYKNHYNPYYLQSVPYVFSRSYQSDLARSSMEEGRNHRSIYLQTGQIAPASLSGETVQQSYSPHKALSGSFKSESHTQPSIITNQQLSDDSNDSEEELDVVGL